jgi:hypothetical protein
LINSGKIYFIKCLDINPYIWLEYNTWGIIFKLSHIGIIMLSSAKAERIFYAIPLYEGFFLTKSLNYKNEGKN